MNWPVVRVGDVAEVSSGFGFPREEQGDTQQELPFFKVGDMNLPGNERLLQVAVNTISQAALRRLKAKPFPASTTVFPKIGAAIATNKKRMLSRPSVVDNNVMGLIPTSHIDARYLFYWMHTVDLMAVANQGPVPSIRKTEVEALSLRLPVLSEQRRIVEILDQADALRKKRSEADAKAARILPALFYKMFGDPATSPMGWPLLPFGALAGKEGFVVDGDWVLSNDMDQNGSIRLVQLADIGRGVFLDQSNRFVNQETFARLKCTEIRESDVLVSRMADPIGRACLVPRLPSRAITAVDVAVVRPDETVAVPEYVVGLCNSNYFLQKAADFATGTTRGRITRRNLEKIESPVPPLELQEKYAKCHEALSRQTKIREDGQRRCDELFALLMRRAFSGHLTAKWREAHMNELLQEMEESSGVMAMNGNTGDMIIGSRRVW